MNSLTWPDHLLTLEEWDALPEDVSRRFELVEGVLQMSPSPGSAHQVASAMLTGQLNDAIVPHGWFAVPDIDVVLEARFPPIVRAPDITVLALDFVRTKPARAVGADVRVAIEIMSPGSRRIDRIAKLADYAEAGIPDYWIVGVDGPVTLDAFRLVDGAYQPVITGATGSVSVSSPVPLTIDLTALTP